MSSAINPLVACPHMDGAWCLQCVQDLVRDQEEDTAEALDSLRTELQSHLKLAAAEAASAAHSAVLDALHRSVLE